RLAADLLRDGAGVGVGGVDEVPARLEEALHERQRGGLVAAPAGHPEGHRAEADLGDPEAAPAESSNAHGGDIAEPSRPRDSGCVSLRLWCARGAGAALAKQGGRGPPFYLAGGLCYLSRR